MKYLITDQELLDYVAGRLNAKDKKELERKAIESGETDLLLYAQLADYAATGTSTDDIIGEDTFMPEKNLCGEGSFDFSFLKAADHVAPQEKNLLKKKNKKD